MQNKERAVSSEQSSGTYLSEASIWMRVNLMISIPPLPSFVGRTWDGPIPQKEIRKLLSGHSIEIVTHTDTCPSDSATEPITGAALTRCPLKLRLTFLSSST